MPEPTEYHKKGFNCCESTILGLCDWLHIQTDVLPQLATGFGGGLGHTGEVCGAVTGSIMALGLKYGRKEPTDKKTRDDLYKMVEHFLDDVKKELGTIKCLELIGIPMNTEEGLAKYRAENMHQVCHGIIEKVSRITQRYLDQSKT
ncbi:MAG: C-GCAxxG-C-C family protein [Candidatus Atribacteria bacterium]|nr:C-GCAxxG-C-C family protein [Candidatus Atribacteria bacterium]